ncbi:hypothetical protein PANT_12c00022 [Moesziomyces antarcticus T-34]|uniref:Uncharacterized protein n=1 Tax=Pseudozyma antarctica (strain T-34) TaxID=1151754 RepID=M9MDM4_PSEA3|nr:hypothetical protein PANT_12c00022 [Moesziomyces antarcticus T-34]
MDTDPFAVWDDPQPASSSNIQPTADAPGAARAADDARISLELEEEDPGWGVASASTSRANSPEKSRKPATQRSRSQASVSPLVTAVPVTASEVPTLVEAAQPSNQADSAQEPKPQQALTAEDAEVVSSAEAHESGEDKDVFEDTEDTLDTPQDPHPAQSLQPLAAQTEPVEEPTEAQGLAEVLENADEAEIEEDEGNNDDDDGFDDFGEPAGSGGGAAEHDDFGDFDDFETGDAPGDDDFGDDDFENQDFDEAADTSAPSVSTSAPLPLQAAAPTRTWTPLDVTPTSNRLDLAPAVSALLPLSSAAEKELTNTALRQVEGAAQVLVSGGSREMWTELSSVPSVKPIDWVRSKTRRDYLISMGVPVNLDEIHSSFDSQSGRSGQLPPLQLKYDSGRSGEGLQRSSSLKLAGTAAGSAVAQRSASTSNSPRDGSSPALGTSTNRERMAERRREELGLGPAPQVDLRRAEELVKKTEDQLTLLSLPALQAMVRELNTLTTSTSSLLTHHLTLRESFQADSEMYNAMIKELVTGAATRFSGAGAGTGSGGRGDMRRSTTMGVASSGAAKTRVNSLPPPGANGRSSPSLSLRGGAASAASPRR